MIKAKICHLFLVCSLMFLLTTPSIALIRGFSPDNYPSEKLTGLGVYFAPDTINIYSQPTYDSSVIQRIHYEYSALMLDTLTTKNQNPHEVFLAYYPYKKIALMTVIDEVPDWIKVIYDYEKNLSGWINLKNTSTKTEYNRLVGNYYTWFEFMRMIARKRGIYYIKGVPEEYKKLRASTEDNAQIIYDDFTKVKGLVIKVIRGNWMLVKACDFGSTSPIGWIRWRDDDGNILIFSPLD